MEPLLQNFNYQDYKDIEIETIANNALFNEDTISISYSHNPLEDEAQKIIGDDEEKKEIKKDAFPFNEGYGFKKIFEKKGMKVEYNNKTQRISLLKKIFASKEMIIDENGKMKRKKKRRKFKPDNIKKKIKARFHKDLKLIINKRLKQAGAQKLFELMPQNFITNMTIKLNNQVMNLTFEELIKFDWSKLIGGKEKKADKNKSKKNLEVLDYLNKNQEISEKSGFNRIKQMKYDEILNAYFSSYEFEKSLEDFYDKNKMEKIEYIEEYFNKAKTYVDFFKNPSKNFDVKDNEISKDLPYTFLDEYDNYFNKNFPVDNCGLNLDESYNDLKVDELFLLGYK